MQHREIFVYSSYRLSIVFCLIVQVCQTSVHNLDIHAVRYPHEGVLCKETSDSSMNIQEVSLTL